MKKDKIKNKLLLTIGTGSILLISSLVVSCTKDENKSIGSKSDLEFMDELTKTTSFTIENRNRLASTVNKEDVIDKKKINMSKLSLEIVNLNANDDEGTLLISYKLSLNNSTTEVKTRKIGGFKTQKQFDQDDINNIFSSLTFSFSIKKNV